MAKHTPAPWTFTEWNEIEARHGLVVAQIPWPKHRARGKEGREDYEYRQGNGRLLAAAPDLYDAAENALEALIGCCVPAGGVDDRKAILEAQQMLRAAIAKATGDA